MNRRLLLWIVPVAALVAGGALLAFGVPGLRNWLKPAPSTNESANKKKGHSVEGDTITLTPETYATLSIRTAPAKEARTGRGLAPLPGSLALDPNRLARVRSRFAGEVIDFGKNGDAKNADARPLQYGDRVLAGQLLLVLWNKDLGEKKSELLDVLSQLHADETRLKGLEEGYKNGAIPENSVREARRAVEAGQIARGKAERTLRAWRLPEDDIKELYAEAKRLSDGKAKRDPQREQDWARVEVRAPITGTLVEKNVNFGDIVDTASDLFKIADLSRLTVWAHLFEEDLPAVLNLPTPLRWTIALKSEPHSVGLVGKVERVGDVVDPTQHTVLITGFVDNPEGRLRAGQFITATIEFPPAADEIQVPTSAVVEDGEESVIFIQPDPHKLEFTMRGVTVVRRTREVYSLKASLKRPRVEPVAFDGRNEPLLQLVPGTLVVTNGVSELRSNIQLSEPKKGAE